LSLSVGSAQAPPESVKSSPPSPPAPEPEPPPPAPPVEVVVGRVIVESGAHASGTQITAATNDRTSPKESVRESFMVNLRPVEKQESTDGAYHDEPAALIRSSGALEPKFLGTPRAAQLSSASVRDELVRSWGLSCFDASAEASSL
jgi:hypothetical protein